VVVNSALEMNTDESNEPKSSEYRVLFTKSRVTVDAGAEDLILELAEDNEVEIDSVCRAGSCQTCKVRLIKGEVDQQVEGDFDDEERAAGFILACSCTPKSDIEIEA
jgi:ferredoxin